MAEIKFSSAASKYFKKLKDKKLKDLFAEKVKAIGENPYLGEPKRGDLVGIYCCDIFYNKANYELAYRILINKNGDVVVIIMAGTRENFYEELKRYMK